MLRCDICGCCLLVIQILHFSVLNVPGGCGSWWAGRDGAPAAPTGVTGVAPAGFWKSWAAKKSSLWLLGHCKCVCAVAGGVGGVLGAFSGHNSPWKRLLEMVQLLWAAPS